MRIGTWRVRVVALALGAALSGEAVGGEALGQADDGAAPPVIAVRGEAARDVKEREAAVLRALAEAAALTEARKPSAMKRSERDAKPESVEVSLTGPAGGVRLSVRGQLPSGFVYRRHVEAGVDGAECGGATALSSLPKGDRPAVDSEVQP